MRLSSCFSRVIITKVQDFDTLPVDPERARARRNARRGGVTPPAAETDQEDFSAAFQAPERVRHRTRMVANGRKPNRVNPCLPAMALDHGVKIQNQILALFLGDGKGSAPAVQAAWKVGRSAGAPWTFSIEPDATHGDEQYLKRANGLLIP